MMPSRDVAAARGVALFVILLLCCLFAFVPGLWGAVVVGGIATTAILGLWLTSDETYSEWLDPHGEQVASGDEPRP